MSGHRERLTVRPPWRGAPEPSHPLVPPLHTLKAEAWSAPPLTHLPVVLDLATPGPGKRQRRQVPTLRGLQVM